MTDSLAPPPSNNKKPPIFAYRGPDPKYRNILFHLLESPIPEGDEWQTGGEKMVFLHSLDREIQPESVKNRFCEYSMGSAHDLTSESVKVSGNLDDCDNGFGGILSMFPEEEFNKNFVRLSKK